MRIYQDQTTGFWMKTGTIGVDLVNLHPESACEGRLCDVHNRRGEEPWASWPLNWRDDRGIMEMIDPRSGIGHPTPAQVQFMRKLHGDTSWVHTSHGCDLGCAGAYNQISEHGQ